MTRHEVPSLFGFGSENVSKVLSELMTQSVSWFINYKGVCKTAPATPGLFNMINIGIEMI